MIRRAPLRGSYSKGVLLSPPSTALDTVVKKIGALPAAAFWALAKSLRVPESVVSESLEQWRLLRGVGTCEVLSSRVLTYAADSDFAGLQKFLERCVKCGLLELPPGFVLVSDETRRTPEVMYPPAGPAIAHLLVVSWDDVHWGPLQVVAGYRAWSGGFSLHPAQGIEGYAVLAYLRPGEELDEALAS